MLLKIFIKRFIFEIPIIQHIDIAYRCIIIEYLEYYNSFQIIEGHILSSVICLIG